MRNILWIVALLMACDSPSKTEENTQHESVGEVQESQTVAPVENRVVTHGGVCAPGGLVSGACDPVNQDCDSGYCKLFYSAGENTLISGCSEPEPNLLAEGQDCAPADKCGPGLICAGKVCRQLCDRSDARGCAPDQFCKTFENAFGFGYCHESC